MDNAYCTNLAITRLGATVPPDMMKYFLIKSFRAANTDLVDLRLGNFSVLLGETTTERIIGGIRPLQFR